MVKAKIPSSVEDLLQETLAEILKNMQVSFGKFKLTISDGVPEGSKLYRIDIDSDEASTLIGYHGETIYALQHLLKTLAWKKLNQNIMVVLDVDGYRKRQEESVLAMAMKKVEAARKTFQDQILPPMSPYFRRVVHLALTKSEYSDITTESVGEGDRRAVVIRVKR